MARRTSHKASHGPARLEKEKNAEQVQAVLGRGYCVVHNFAQLAAGSIGCPFESAVAISGDYVMVVGGLHEDVEGIFEAYVREVGVNRVYQGPPLGDADNLANLPSRDVGVGPERAVGVAGDSLVLHRSFDINRGCRGRDSPLWPFGNGRGMAHRLPGGFDTGPAAPESALNV
jgi:hypothetical protein